MSCIISVKRSKVCKVGIFNHYQLIFATQRQKVFVQFTFIFLSFVKALKLLTQDVYLLLCQRWAREARLKLHLTVSIVRSRISSKIMLRLVWLQILLLKLSTVIGTNLSQRQAWLLKTFEPHNVVIHFFDSKIKKTLCKRNYITENRFDFLHFSIVGFSVSFMFASLTFSPNFGLNCEWILDNKTAGCLSSSNLKSND